MGCGSSTQQVPHSSKEAEQNPNKAARGLVFRIKVLSAIHLRSKHSVNVGQTNATRFESTVDPYVMMRSTGSQTVHKTTTAVHNSESPTWHEEFFFCVDRYDPVLTIEVKDKEALHSDLVVGKAVVKLHGLISKTGAKEVWVPLVDTETTNAIPTVVGELGFTVTECYRMKCQPVSVNRVAPLPSALAKGIAVECKHGQQPAVTTDILGKVNPVFDNAPIATFYIPYGEVSQATFTVWSKRYVGPPLARGYFHLKCRGNPNLHHNGQSIEFPLNYATHHDSPEGTGWKVEDPQVKGQWEPLHGSFALKVNLWDDALIENVRPMPEVTEEVKSFWPPSRPGTLKYFCKLNEAKNLPDSTSMEANAENTSRFVRLEYGRDVFDTQKVNSVDSNLSFYENFLFVMQPALLEEQNQALRAAKLLPPTENEAYAQLRLSAWEKSKTSQDSLGIGVADLREMRPGRSIPLTVPMGSAASGGTDGAQTTMDLLLFHHYSVKITGVHVFSQKDYNGLVDPFVTLRMGQTSYRSRVMQEDRHPLFNDTFRFPVHPGSSIDDLTLHISVFDANFIVFGTGMKNDLIGMVDVDMSKLKPRESVTMTLPARLCQETHDADITIELRNELAPKDNTLAIHGARYGFRVKWFEDDFNVAKDEDLDDLFTAPEFLGLSSPHRYPSDPLPSWVDVTEMVRSLVENNRLVIDPSGDKNYLSRTFWSAVPDPDAKQQPPAPPYTSSPPPPVVTPDAQQPAAPDQTQQSPSTPPSAPNAIQGDSGSNQQESSPASGDAPPTNNRSGDAAATNQTPPPQPLQLSAGDQTIPPAPGAGIDLPYLYGLKRGRRMLQIRYSIGEGEPETATIYETPGSDSPADGSDLYLSIEIDPPVIEGSSILHSNLTFAIDAAARRVEESNEEAARLQAKLEEMETKQKEAEEAAALATKEKEEAEAAQAAALAEKMKEIGESEARLKELKDASDEQRKAEEEKLAGLKAGVASEEEALKQRIETLRLEEEESKRRADAAKADSERVKANSLAASAAAAEDAGKAAARAREKANAEADEADRLRKLVEEYEAEKLKAKEDAEQARLEREEEERQNVELRAKQEKEAQELADRIMALKAGEEEAKRAQLQADQDRLAREQKEREDREQRARFQKEERELQERMMKERIERLKMQERDSEEKLKKANQEMKRKEEEAALRAQKMQQMQPTSSANYPDYWTRGLKMDGSLNKVELTHDPLWSQRFQSLLDDTCRRNTLGAGRDQIIKSGKYDRLVFHKAYRLENAKLYSLYAAHRDLQLSTPKQGIAAKTHDVPSSQWIVDECGLRQKERNELLLWHGTKPDFVDIIATDGFDERVSKLSGLFGAGVYLADEVSKSDQYTTPTPANDPKNGVYHIFLVRGTMGNYKFITEGTKDARRAPPGCQSILGQIDKNKYREYVLYDGWLAYPEYLIEYKRRYVK